MQTIYNTHRIIILLFLAACFVVNGWSQECGVAFKTVEVSDTKGKSIDNATIEIVAKLPEEEYKNLGHKYIIKMSASDAEAAIERNSLKPFTTDIYCKNPLKQHRGKTKVKKISEQKPPSTENFGFCTAELLLQPLLLKVSAPGYVTDYYVGNFLGGCRMTYEFVLIKEGEKP